jgi:hypothetical protein
MERQSADRSSRRSRDERGTAFGDAECVFWNERDTAGGEVAKDDGDTPVMIRRRRPAHREVAAMNDTQLGDAECVFLEQA